MKTIISRLLLLMAVVMTFSCVHEYPEGEGIDPTNIQTTIQLYTEPELTRAVQQSPGVGLPYMYFIVEVYKDSYDGELVMRKTAGVEKSESGAASIELPIDLHAGNYKVVAWAIGSESKDEPGTLFNVDDLAAIHFNGEYTGSTEKKECYEARFDMNLKDQGWYGTARYSQEMLTPMGGVEIISEDIEAFYKIIASRAGADDLANYYIRWNYGLYFPTAYNLYTGLPNKAETGVAFNSDIKERSDKEASLGYDYIFINGESTTVTLSLEVYDRTTGEQINVYSGIEVPLERGKVTVIRGKFLTQKHDSGIGIDPGFDGDIDITIPD